MKISATKKRKGFTLIELLVVIAILGALAGVGIPTVLGMLVERDRTKVRGKLQEIQKMMTTFKTDVGAYPCDRTAESGRCTRAADRYGVTMTGDTSNPYFRQMFYKSKGGPSEEAFHMTMDGMVDTPDEEKNGGKLLEAGECAFAYVMTQETDEDNAGKKKAKKKDKAAPVGTVRKNPVSSGILVYACVDPSDTPTPLPELTFNLAPLSDMTFGVHTDGKVVELKLDEKLESDGGDIGRYIPGSEDFPKEEDQKKFIILSPETI